MKALMLLVLCICIGGAANAKVSYHADEVRGGYDFVLYAPDSIKSPMPLVIALHSRSASGNNLQTVDYFGTIDAIESGMNVDAFVLAPQATGSKWDIDKIIADVDYLIDNYDIDANRIYAVGMSMGGNGVADLAANYPDRIAAAIILAGGLTDGKTSELSKVPVWVIRGLNDREEAIRRTDEMVEEIRRVDGSRIVYSRIPGLDHRQHERILYMPVIYDWLLSHNLQQVNRPINMTVDITSKTLNGAYKGLKLREGSAAKRKSRGGHRHR